MYASYDPLPVAMKLQSRSVLVSAFHRNSWNIYLAHLTSMFLAVCSVSIPRLLVGPPEIGFLLKGLRAAWVELIISSVLYCSSDFHVMFWSSDLHVKFTSKSTLKQH